VAVEVTIETVATADPEAVLAAVAVAPFFREGRPLQVSVSVIRVETLMTTAGVVILLVGVVAPLKPAMMIMKTLIGQVMAETEWTALDFLGVHLVRTASLVVVEAVAMETVEIR
jgi:hypothetical protein